MNGRLALALPLVGLLFVLVGCDDDDSDDGDEPELRVPGFDTLPPAPPPTMPTGPTEFDPPLAVPGFETLPPPPMPQMPPGMQPGQVPPGVQPGQVPGAPVTLAAGFMPDPQTAAGVAGGPLDASTMSPECGGNIASAPNHTLQLSTPFNPLRILVSSQVDTTLVVRGPDGSFHCNDDTEGLNPIVQGPFAPGVYSVWVGTHQSAQQPTPYAIGFSELGQVTTAQLAQAAAGAQPPMQPQ